MDIRALVLVSNPVEAAADPTPLSSLAPALLEVAGKTALQRTVERLQEFGIATVMTITDSDAALHERNGNGATLQAASREWFWRAAENAFNDIAQDGAELVLLIHLGGYAEINLERFVQFHLDQRARVTQLWAEGGARD